MSKPTPVVDVRAICSQYEVTWVPEFARHDPELAAQYTFRLRPVSEGDDLAEREFARSIRGYTDAERKQMLDEGATLSLSRKVEINDRSERGRRLLKLWRLRRYVIPPEELKACFEPFEKIGEGYEVHADDPLLKLPGPLLVELHTEVEKLIIASTQFVRMPEGLQPAEVQNAEGAAPLS